jgi:hypothetical protein
MSEKIRSINFSPDEFLSGVLGMRAVDVGVYWAACSLMYAGDGTIQEDDERLFRLMSERKSVIRASINRLVEAGKMQRTDAGLTVERVWSEREAALERMRRSREAGLKGGRPSGDVDKNQQVSKTSGLFEDKAITTTTTTTTNKNTPVVPKGTSYSVGFESFWKVYPHKVGKAAAFKAYQRAIKKTDAETVLRGVSAYKRSKPDDRAWCNPSTFLGQERWLDETVGAGEDAPMTASEVEATHIRRLVKFRNTGTWPDFLGPKPGEAGCLVPEDLVKSVLGDQP